MNLKRGYIIFFIALAALIGAIYFFIPPTIRISKTVKIKAFDANVFSLLADSASWRKWDKAFNTDGYSFDIIKSNFPLVFLEAKNSQLSIPIEIQILSNDKMDSCHLSWHAELEAGSAPWSRIKSYMEATELKSIFSKKMDSLKSYASKIENIYGIRISESKVTDTIIAVLTVYETDAPSESLICKMTDSLRMKINTAKILITGSAMTTIRNEGDKYKIMVGFPVNKKPADDSHLDYKGMVPGKLLSAIIYGGPASIRQGILQMKKYITDRSIEEVAVPYQVHLNNRCELTDTTKWITKICNPVF